MKNPQLPTPSQLAELFWYDAIGGLLIRRVDAGRWGREKEGTIAGSINGEGYLVVTAFGLRLLAHRVAFAIAHGDWPLGQIDHIDGNRQNNRLLNLRDVTPSENNQNLRQAKGKTESGLLGVRPMGSRWYAEIKLNGMRRFLGSFSTPEDAYSAYLSAKREMHPYSTI